MRVSRFCWVVTVAALAVVSALPLEAEATPRGAKARVRGPAKVMEVLADVAKGLKTTRYQHVTRVRAKRGEYFFDCSGMAQWVLRRSAPGALRAVGTRAGGARPLAVNFYKRIARVPVGEKRGPWYRVADASQGMPGDVIAWRRPPWFPSKSTGHVAFVVSPPVKNTGAVPGYLYRIADATRFPHEDDSRGRGETGFGTGVMLVATDPAGQPAGYGWFGSRSTDEWVVPCEMAIGRPLR